MDASTSFAGAGEDQRPTFTLRRWLHEMKFVMNYLYMQWTEVGGDLHSCFDSATSTVHFVYTKEDSNTAAHVGTLISTYLGPLRVAQSLIQVPAAVHLRVDCYRITSKAHDRVRQYSIVSRPERWLHNVVKGFRRSEISVRILGPRRPAGPAYSRFVFHVAGASLLAGSFSVVDFADALAELPEPHDTESEGNDESNSIDESDSSGSDSDADSTDSDEEDPSESDVNDSEDSTSHSEDSESGIDTSDFDDESVTIGSGSIADADDAAADEDEYNALSPPHKDGDSYSD